MAATLCRLGANAFRRSVLFTSVRASSGASGPPADQHSGKKPSDVQMPDAFGHAVGLERAEMMDDMSGIEDPFDIAVAHANNMGLDHTAAIKVHSIYGERLVGCLCEEDSNSIVWMTLTKGQARQCRCGFWFQLAEGKKA